MYKLKIAPLDIANSTDYIYQDISGAPSRQLMIRELRQNAIDSAINAKNPRIEWLGVDPLDFGLKIVSSKDKQEYSKLCVWNTGPGLNPKNLRKATDLGVLINKKLGIHANQGRGFKYCGLGPNEFGIVFASSCNGKLSRTLMVLDKKTNTYGRFLFDGHDVVDITHLKDTLELKYGMPGDEDWTAVILLGKEPNQDTTTHPFDPHTKESEGWLADQIYRRFYYNSSIEEKLRIGQSFKHKSFIMIKNLDDVLRTRLAEAKEGVKHTTDNLQYEEVILADGTKIKYIYDGIHPLNKDETVLAYSSPVSRKVLFSGLIYQGEMFDVQDGSPWCSTAMHLNITAKANLFHVFVEFPSGGNVKMSRDRSHLSYENTNEKITLVSFAKLIVSNQPSWFKEKVDSFKPKAFDTEKLKETFQSLLDQMRIIVRGIVTKGASGKGGKNVDKEESDNKKTTNSTPPGTSEDITGKFKIPKQVPDLVWLEDEKSVKDCSATNINKYAAVLENNTLFINMTHSLISNLVSSLVNEFVHNNPQIDDLNDALIKNATAVIKTAATYEIMRGIVCAFAESSEKYATEEDQVAITSSIVLTSHVRKICFDIEELCKKKLTPLMGSDTVVNVSSERLIEDDGLSVDAVNAYNNFTDTQRKEPSPLEKLFNLI